MDSDASLNQDLKFDIKKDLTVGKKLQKELKKVQIDKAKVTNFNDMQQSPSLPTVTRGIEEEASSISGDIDPPTVLESRNLHFIPPQDLKVTVEK